MPIAEQTLGRRRCSWKRHRLCLQETVVCLSEDSKAGSHSERCECQDGSLHGVSAAQGRAVGLDRGASLEAMHCLGLLKTVPILALNVQCPGTRLYPWHTGQMGLLPRSGSGWKTSSPWPAKQKCGCLRSGLTDAEPKAFLYKAFGFSLRASSHENLLRTMVSYLLRTSHEELQQREGIAVALSILSTRHLEIVLEELEVCGARLTDSDSFILKLSEEHQQREWVLLCYTVYLSYSKIILESDGAVFVHVDAILALVMQHYHDCVVKKDENVKLDYLNALSILTDILSSQQHLAFQLEFPHKLTIVTCMVELIREEPMTSISSPIRQKAMTIISNFRMLRPLLGIEERVEILQTCFGSVLCLPATEVLQKEASSPEEAQANVVLLEETLQSLLSLMEALVLETPTWIQNCLELLDRWLNSQRVHEQERAMWCAARILEFTTKMDNFKMEIEFTGLENLVMLLAKRCQDPAASIRFLSSEAVYQLHCILLRKKKMQRETAGLQEDDGKIEVYSAKIFNQNTFEIAKAFAEFFTQTQLTNLVLMAEEDLTDSRAQASLASAQFMSALIEERGTDIIEVEEMVENILYLLRLQLEHDTEKETLRAMCSLAGSNTHTVVPVLLNKPLPWDRTLLTLWNVFGTQKKTTVNVLQLLIGILENHSIQETMKRNPQPDAVACALYEMLSGSLCHKAIQELYPQLLLAVLHHLHWVVKQKVPEEIVVYSKDEGSGSRSKTFDSKRCALEVVKMVVLAAANEGVMVHADQHKCWDLLICPRFCYLGIMELTSGIVKNCEPAMLHKILNLVTNLINSSDSDQKVVARAVYAQLLGNQSMTKTSGQDFVGNLSEWIKERDLIMKEIGLCGISNLTAHPGNVRVGAKWESSVSL
ncbi:maestro heat-like repeat family member 5 [Rhynchonycteris naso]